MIRQEILEGLLPITYEERAILDGKRDIDKSIYTTSGGDVINYERLLGEGRIISVRKHTRFVHFPRHTHDYIEAVYMCAGETVHVINGKETVLGEGELLFLGRGASHEILPAGEGDIAVNFIIRPAFFDKTLELLGDEKTPVKNLLINSLFDRESQGYLHFKVSGVLPIQNLVENLLWALLSGSSDDSTVNQVTMALLFMQLVDRSDTLVYERREDEAVLKVLRYIEDNYRDASLKSVANLLHYDFYWLSHEIKNRTGKTYTEHLQEKRLSQAALLLKSTTLSVEDVALAVGYENKSYFHRIFTNRFGSTPRKHAKSK